MTKLLVLRPEPGASFTVDQARRRGLEAVRVPLFVIQPVSWALPDLVDFDGLLITSVNALRHAGQQLNSLRRLPVYAVGEVTATVARSIAFGIAATGDSGVDGLLASIEPDLKLLHLCGEDRRTPQQGRQAITPVIVYRSKAIESPDLTAAADSLALIHSPRAGRRFAELAPDKASITIIAISRAAADAAGDGWKSVEVAEQPSDDALLALAARLCNNSPPE